MNCEKQFVFYAVILSFKLEAGGPGRAENSELNYDGRLEKVKYLDSEILISVIVCNARKFSCRRL